MKKKISILLVLAMVLSMIPMVAFADVTQPNRFASTFTVDTTAVTANGTDVAKVTVYVFDGNNQPMEGQSVVVASDRGATDTVTALPTPAVTDANGKIEFEVKSNITGTAKFGVGLLQNAAAMTRFLQGDTVNPETATTVGLVGQPFNITFAAPSANGMTLTAPIPTGATKPTVVADGLTEMTVTARVYTAGNAPVAGQTVTFSANKTGLRFDKQTYTTNVAGIVTAKVTSTRAGDYTIRAASGSLSKELDVNFSAQTTPFTIEKVGGDNQLVARNSESGWITVAVKDINGNRIIDPAVLTGNISFPTKPSGSSIAVSTAVGKNDDDNLRFKVRPDREGDYVIRVRLANGSFVEFNLTSREMGTITGLELSYDTTMVAHGAKSGAASASFVDAAGVKQTATNTALTYSLSDSRFGTLAPNGEFTATSDDKITGVVTITAIDTSRNLVAAFDITVISAPVTISLKADREVTPIDEEATVTVSLLNANGDVAGFGVNGANTRTIDVRVVRRPEGAIVSTSTVGNVNNNLERKGTNDIRVSSTVKGEVVLQVIVSDGAPTPRLLSRSITLNFGEPVPERVVIGAKNVVLTIDGAMAVVDGRPQMLDVAPFIKDSRTFVPVRFIAEALGAEVAFTTNAAGLTETVTLTRPDRVVTMTIGSNVLTVVHHGQATTVVADVAPFVTNGRTVLPFRALAEAMGAEVDYGMKADNSGVAWVSFNQ